MNMNTALDARHVFFFLYQVGELTASGNSSDNGTERQRGQRTRSKGTKRPKNQEQEQRAGNKGEQRTSRKRDLGNLKSKTKELTDKGKTNC